MRSRVLDEGRVIPPVNDRPHFLVWLARRLRPREGYAVLLLAWIAVVSLPAALLESKLIAGLGAGPGFATAALLLAWWLAQRRLHAGPGTGLLAVAGGGAILTWGVYVLTPWPWLGQGVRWLAWALGTRVTPAPALDAFAAQGEALARFGGRVGWWVEGLVTGRGGADNLVVVALAYLLVWTLAAWAGWWLARGGQPFVALLPTGILLANLVYWSEQGYWELLNFLGAIPPLLILLRMARQMRSWDQAGVDYSPEIRLDTGMTALGIGFLVVILAPTLPFLTSNNLSQAFWRLFESPYQQIGQQLDASFALARPGRSLVPPSGVAPGGLPRAHLLGGRPELGQAVALRARVRDAGAGHTLYWRGQTFAYYTGLGWAEDSQTLTRQAFNAGEPWDTAPPPAYRRSVLAAVTLVAASRAVLYAPGEPVSIDRPYWALQRAAGDLVALAPEASPAQYSVLSAVPVVDATALRAASAGYPSALLARYLQLPAGLTPELVAYAAEIAQGGAASTSAPRTPYDRAVAIEAALRQIPYSLDVPVPPQDREVVAWFLFDQRQGYCDYFATAMVVLARLNGIPARLAVGYAPGSFDARAGEYVVTELQAHSWPELYFPGYGWIPFEPTPAQAAPARTELAAPPTLPSLPDDLAAGMVELRGLATAATAARRRASTRQGVLALLNGLLAVWLALGLARRLGPARVMAAAGDVGVAYARLLRWGEWLGCPPRPADTPREYAAALADAVAATGTRTRFSRWAASTAVDTVQAGAAALAQEYEAALYGPVPLSEPAPTTPLTDPDRQARLWAALRRLWLARVTSRPTAR